MLRICVLGPVLALALAGAARADFVRYTIPGSNAQIVLEGKIQNSGRTVALTHAKYGRLVFWREHVELFPVESVKNQIKKKLMAAARKQDADEMFNLSSSLLRHGYLEEFYETIEAILELDADHKGAKRIVALKKQFDQALPESEEEEVVFRKLVPMKHMKVLRSKHFILMHDLPDPPARSKEPSRPVQRLELLERVYEAFLLFFAARGAPLEIPRERMRQVLFHQQKDYLTFAESINPFLKSTNGFWDPQKNVSFFYTHATAEEFKKLQELAADLQEKKKELQRRRAPGDAAFIHMANVIDLLVKVAQENEDLEVVTHETTHQLAGTTGLLPRHIMVPKWVHEGLATYFETPRDASWSGIGAVNALRLEWYRGLEQDKKHSNLSFIIGDSIFDLAGSHGSLLHAYGQSWAVTHFLMERHFDEFIQFYRLLGHMPPDLKLSPQIVNNLFDRVFKTDRKALDLEWRTYMNSLKTDFEKAVEKAER